MFDHLNTREILGGEIMVNLILIVFSSRCLTLFNQFKLNCSVNKINFTFNKLLNALQVVEGIIKGYPSIKNMKKASFFKHFPKGNVKQKKKKILSNPNKVQNQRESISI